MLNNKNFTFYNARNRLHQLSDYNLLLCYESQKKDFLIIIIFFSQVQG